MYMTVAVLVTTCCYCLRTYHGTLHLGSIGSLSIYSEKYGRWATAAVSTRDYRVRDRTIDLNNDNDVDVVEDGFDAAATVRDWGRTQDLHGFALSIYILYFIYIYMYICIDAYIKYILYICN